MPEARKIITRCGSTVLVDDEDFEYLSKFKWYLRRNPSGYVRVVRNLPTTRGCKLAMSRDIMEVVDEKILVDHINGNTLDNRKSNLRLCNKSENACNRGAIKTNGNRLKGVSRDRNRFKASITKNQEYIHLGCFSTAEEAHAAYVAAVGKFHGEFANSRRVE